MNSTNHIDQSTSDNRPINTTTNELASASTGNLTNSIQTMASTATTMTSENDLNKTTADITMTPTKTSVTSATEKICKK